MKRDGPVRYSVVVSIIAFLLALAAAAPPAEAQNYYAGRTVTMIVPFGPGGGADTWARFLAPRFAKELGPNVTVGVMNIPGGGGVLGTVEFMQRRRPDGLTLFVGSVSWFTLYGTRHPTVLQLIRLADHAPILGSGFGSVVFGRPDAVSSPKDLLNPKKPLVFGGLSPDAVDLLPLIVFDMLGADVKVIMGYDGRGPARIAFERGEINVNLQTAFAYRANVVPLVEQRLAVPLFATGAVDDEGRMLRDPAFPDILSPHEVYRELRGKEPSGTAWEVYRALLGVISKVDKALIVHGKAPPQAVHELQEAGRRLAANQAFRAEAAKLAGPYPWFTAKGLGQAFSELDALPKERVNWLLGFLKRYGLER